MAQIQITVPEPLLDWVEAQLRTGRTVDAQDYLRDLIRHDQEAGDALWAALEDGAASGVSTQSLDDVWQAAKAKAGYG